MPSRRQLMLAVAAAALPGARVALADATLRPMRLLVGAAPGSVMDIAARQIGESLTARTGQAVLVDNRPSAGGIQALELLRQAPADGLTVGLVHAVQMTAASSLFPGLPYDTERDFAPVGILFSGPQVLVVHPSIAASNWGELIKLIKSEPDRCRYATPGNGTPQHVSMEQIKAATGLRVQHIPYRGPAATAAVLSGEVELLLEGVMPLLPHIRAGRLRPIAIGGRQRVSVLAEVPTFDEIGVAGIRSVWVGLVVPRSTPEDVVHKLNQSLTLVMQSPELRNAFEASGRIVNPGTPEAMASTIRMEIPLWRDVVRRARITTD
jgi:tripartite-type tricarboxylate transporter receptor subunit TctC